MQVTVMMAVFIGVSPYTPSCVSGSTDVNATTNEKMIEMMNCAKAARNVGVCNRRGGRGGFSSFEAGGEMYLDLVTNSKHDSLLLNMERNVAINGLMANGDEEQRTKQVG
jgi:hypothetical protein